jgi:hypothetical protein
MFSIEKFYIFNNRSSKEIREKIQFLEGQKTDNLMFKKMKVKISSEVITFECF